jgi:hypothetical protein
MIRTALVLSALLLSGCSQKEAPADGTPTGPIARVLLDSAGGILLNGRATTVAALTDSLRVLATQSGGVIYSRTPADREPSPVQAAVMRQVLDAIMAARLPVQLVRPESLSTAGR